MKAVTLTLLFVCGVALGQQFKPSDYEYIEYDDIAPLDDSLFLQKDEPVALARASLEERQEQSAFIPIQGNNRPVRNPATQNEPKFNIPNQIKEREPEDRYHPGPVKLEEPVDIPDYLQYEYDYEDIPQESESHKSPLARSPVQEGPVYQIPPQLYKPQVRPLSKPERGSYNPESQNIIYDDKLTEEELLALEEEENNKPDKLSLLLRETKFDCIDKGDGYYADISLNCEVFHYCQDRVRHSWICPENQAFDQVHLICMPQSDQTACKDSSSFYFVNEYLHQPIVDEANKTIGYENRFYPPGYTHDDVDYVQEEPGYYSNERPNRIRQQTKPQSRPINEYYGSPSEHEELPPNSYNPILPPPPRFRPAQNPFGSAANQKPAFANPPRQDQDVFYDSEAVNIPLSHRRSQDYQPRKEMKMQKFEDFVDIEELLQQKTEQES